MAIRTYKVTLDSKNTIAPEPVFLRQGDKTGAVVIDATLMDNGAPVSLEGLTPMFKGNTADGQAVIADSTGFNIVNASGGEFTYQVPNALSSVPGKIKVAYFSFLDSSGAQSTFNVVFFVEKAADMAQDNAKDWVSNLNEIIDQYNQLVNNAHSSWQDFVNENKEIIESIDPGGTLLTEVIAARNGKSNLKTRLDDEHAQVTAQLTDNAKVVSDVFINVKNGKFGAKGDGITDDTTAIQSALNSLDGTGGICYLPAGTYLINKTIIIPLNVHLKGASKVLTIIKPTQQFKDDMIAGVLGEHISWNIIANKNFNVSGMLRYSSSYDIEISNIYFIFDDTRTSLPEDKNNCMAFNNCKRIIVRDCRFLNFGQHSVDLSGVQDALIERTFTYNSYWASIQIDQAGGTYQGAQDNVQASENIIIKDNYIENTKSDYGAIHIHKNGGNNISIINNVINECKVGITTDNYYRDDWGIGLNNNLLIEKNSIISNVEGSLGISIAKNFNDVKILKNKVQTYNGEPLFFRGGKPNYWSINNYIENNYFRGRTVNIIGIRGGSLTSNTFSLTEDKIKISCDRFTVNDNLFGGFGVLLLDTTVTDPRDASTYIFKNDYSQYGNNQFWDKNVSGDGVSFKVVANDFRLLTFLNNPIYFSTNTAFDFSELVISSGIEIQDVFRTKKRVVPTTGRLINGLLIGTQSYDETLKKPIWWNGTAWTDSNGTVI